MGSPVVRASGLNSNDFSRFTSNFKTVNLKSLVISPIHFGQSEITSNFTNAFQSISEITTNFTNNSI